MTEQDKLQALRRLIKRMSHPSEFPVQQQRAQELETVLKRKATSAPQVANVALKDHALIVRLIRLANSPRLGVASGRIATVSHAVAMLGFASVQRIVRRAHSFKKFNASHPAEASTYRAATTNALLAAIVAKNLAEHVGELYPDYELVPEEVFVATVLHDLGRHLAIVYYPDKLQRLLKRVQLKGHSEEQAAVGLFGVPLPTLGQALAKRWRLPERLSTAMKPLASGAVPRPKTSAEFMHHLAAFANEATQLAVTASFHEREARFIMLSDRYYRSLRLAERQLKNLLYRIVVQLRDPTAIEKIDVARSDMLRAALTASGLDVDPVTVEVRARERLEAARFEAGCELLGVDEALDGFAARLLRALPAVVDGDVLLDLRNAIWEGLKKIGLPPSMDYKLQGLQDADEFEVPPGVSHAAAKRMGLATKRGAGFGGGAQTVVLVIVVGRFPGALEPGKEPAPVKRPRTGETDVEDLLQQQEGSLLPLDDDDLDEEAQLDDEELFRLLDEDFDLFQG